MEDEKGVLRIHENELDENHMTLRERMKIEKQKDEEFWEDFKRRLKEAEKIDLEKMQKFLDDEKERRELEELYGNNEEKRKGFEGDFER